MKFIALAVCCCISFAAIAQDSTVHAPNALPTDTITSIRIQAKFPGGQNAWRAFLEEYVHPETPANHKAPLGKYIVIVSFLVDTLGKVSEVKILQDPGYGTADDVLEVFKHSPDWLPATINGKPVKYRQKQNITYQVTEK